jgi:hypothetical protein
MRALPHSPTGLSFVPGCTSNCAAGAGVIFSGVYMRREAPTPAATGWLLDLAASNGPMLVVLRRDPVEAGAAAVGHLIDAGIAADAAQARDMVADADPQFVAVTW